jgi:hypothetical protein
MNEFWDDDEFPLAYLITIRTFGTWLHGDERESVDRHGKNVYGTERIGANIKLRNKMQNAAKGPSFIFDKRQKEIVTETIKEVCKNREYFLHAVNA